MISNFYMTASIWLTGYNHKGSTRSFQCYDIIKIQFSNYMYRNFCEINSKFSFLSLLSIKIFLHIIIITFNNSSAVQMYISSNQHLFFQKRDQEPTFAVFWADNPPKTIAVHCIWHECTFIPIVRSKIYILELCHIILTYGNQCSKFTLKSKLGHLNGTTYHGDRIKSFKHLPHGKSILLA